MSCEFAFYTQRENWQVIELLMAQKKKKHETKIKSQKMNVNVMQKCMELLCVVINNWCIWQTRNRRREMLCSLTQRNHINTMVLDKQKFHTLISFDK